MKLSVLSFVQLYFAAGAVRADPDGSKQNHKDLYFSNSRRLGQVYHTAYDSKIVGGEPAAPGEFPWFVDWEGCGASLIHPQVILSAAHCDAGISNFFGNNVYVGSFREDSSQNGALRRRLTRRVSHEDYNSRTLAYDFMVGKLDEPIPDTVPILPINVDPAVPTDGQDLVVMGHGTTSPGGSVSSLLRKVTVQYVPTGECNAEESYDGSVLGNIMMCAGVDGGNKDSCQGDSGGPIVQCTDETNSDCSQVGVVSWGIGCGDEDYPGVYSRVSGAVDWIQQKVCELTEGQDNQPDYCNTDGSPSTPNPTPAPTPANQPTATTSPPVNETPVDGKVLVRFKLRFDGWPSEITWALFQDGVQILQGGPYDTAEAEHTWNLPKGASYRLDVYDSFGDGLCCNYGDGGYDAVIVNGDGTTSELFSSNGQFTEISVKEFTLMEDGEVDSSSPPVSTPAPTPGPTPTPTPMPTFKPTTAAPIPGTPVPTPNQPPPCEDKPELFFVDLLEENQPCSFLVEQPRFGYLCRFLDVASVCKRTCNVCDYFASS